MYFIDTAEPYIYDHVHYRTSSKSAMTGGHYHEMDITKLGFRDISLLEKIGNCRHSIAMKYMV